MTVTPRPLEPDATIGILGGGQLGRMLALAAARLGFKCHVLCPDPGSPAFDVVRRVTEADYLDFAALDRFAAAGLDGIEVFYAAHDEEQTRVLHDATREHGLLATGSADFHGPEHERFSRFGAFELYGLAPELGPIGA